MLEITKTQTAVFDVLGIQGGEGGRWFSGPGNGGISATVYWDPEGRLGGSDGVLGLRLNGGISGTLKLDANGLCCGEDMVGGSGE